jgi:hypothetical protein
LENYKTLSDMKAPAPKVRVGGEVDTMCTRCHMILGHTILAMEHGHPVRVQCNTCRSQHKYHDQEAAASRREAAAKRESTRRPIGQRPQSTAQPISSRAWKEATAGKDLSSPFPYDPHQTFSDGQVIQHAKFGTGVVIALKEGHKVTVVFEDAIRVLQAGKA